MSILDQATTSQFTWRDQSISALGIPAGTMVHRIFRHPGMDWAPPPEAFRTGRLDPPKGHRALFSTLYTAESGITAAFESRALRMEPSPGGDRLFAPRDDPALPPRRYVQHRLNTAALFVNFEERNTARAFGLDPDAIIDNYGSWQRAAMMVYTELVASPPASLAHVVGICHQSKHRGSNGWNFGFFHGSHEAVLTRGSSVALDLAELLHTHRVVLPAA